MVNNLNNLYYNPDPNKTVINAGVTDTKQTINGTVYNVGDEITADDAYAHNVETGAFRGLGTMYSPLYEKYIFAILD